MSKRIILLNTPDLKRGKKPLGEEFTIIKETLNIRAFVESGKTLYISILKQ